MITEFVRGDIVFVHNRDTAIGSEQDGDRPAVIVSNDNCNAHSPCVTVVWLTTKPKRDLPTHVTLHSLPKTSIAICEQLCTVSKERIQQVIGTITANEMQQIELAVCIQLGIAEIPHSESSEPDNCEEYDVSEAESRISSLEDELYDTEVKLANATNELDTYKKLYNELLNRVLK